MSIKISALPSAASVLSADVVPVVSGAATKQVTVSALLSTPLAQRLVSGVTWNIDSGAAPDTLLDFDTSVANSKAKLPAPTAGRVLWFLDKTGNAAVNNAQILPNGAETINGAPSQFVLSANRVMVRLESDGTNWFATVAAPTAGGGSVPTGTGLPHITAGAQDAAAIHGTVAGQIPVVNAGVTDVAFVAVSGDGTLAASGAFYTVSITGAGGTGTSVAIGSQASPFTFAFAAAVTQYAISFGGTTRATIDATHGHITAGGGGTDYLAALGPLTSYETSYAGLWLLPNATARTSGNPAVYSDSSNLFINARIGGGTVNVSFAGGAAVSKWDNSAGIHSEGLAQVGNGTAWGSVNGVGTQAMADANQTPAAAVYTQTCIATTGAITANRDLVLPTATDAQGYRKWLDNRCTGAFSVNVRCAAGTAILVGNGKKAEVWIDSRGVTRMTADI